MTTKESVQKLKAFLESEYINNEQMGSPSIGAAIRDLLTDTLHLCDSEGLDIQDRLQGALEAHAEESEEITIDELSRICRVRTEWVRELVDEGVVEPLPVHRTQWRFAATSIVRVQKADRLQRDLGVNLAGTALILDLLDKIEALEARLRGVAQVPAPEDGETD